MDRCKCTNEPGVLTGVWKRWETHLHHLLYVFLDDCRVRIGLHRHSPLIDHRGLRVRRGSRAGVLLQPIRNQRPSDQYQHRVEKSVMLQRREGTESTGRHCTEQGLLQRGKMSRENKNKDYQYAYDAFLCVTQYPEHAVYAQRFIKLPHRMKLQTVWNEAEINSERLWAAHHWLPRLSLQRHLVDLLLCVVLIQRHLHRPAFISVIRSVTFTYIHTTP